MTDDIAIRPAEPEDLAAIVALWGEMMREHEAQDPRVQLAEGALMAYGSYAGYHVSNSESSVRVAVARGRVIGFCLLSISRNLQMFLPPRYGYLSDLVVAEAWRRRGIGRLLVEASLSWLRAHRVYSVQLQHYAFNRAGQAFWQAMGFTPFYTRMWLDTPPRRGAGPE